jgi:hypothetical protein
MWKFYLRRSLLLLLVTSSLLLLRRHCFFFLALVLFSQPPSASPLYAHQESCSSIEDGQEGDEEADSALDSLFLRLYGSEAKKEGFLSESAEIIFPRDKAVPAPPAGY